MADVQRLTKNIQPANFDWDDPKEDSHSFNMENYVFPSWDSQKSVGYNLIRNVFNIKPATPNPLSGGHDHAGKAHWNHKVVIVTEQLAPDIYVTNTADDWLGRRSPAGKLLRQRKSSGDPYIKALANKVMAGSKRGQYNFLQGNRPYNPKNRVHNGFPKRLLKCRKIRENIGQPRLSQRAVLSSLQGVSKVNASHLAQIKRIPRNKPLVCSCRSSRRRKEKGSTTPFGRYCPKHSMWPNMGTSNSIEVVSANEHCNKIYGSTLMYCKVPHEDNFVFNASYTLKKTKKPGYECTAWATVKGNGDYCNQYRFPGMSKDPYDPLDWKRAPEESLSRAPCMPYCQNLCSYPPYKKKKPSKKERTTTDCPTMCPLKFPTPSATPTTCATTTKKISTTCKEITSTSSETTSQEEEDENECNSEDSKTELDCEDPKNNLSDAQDTNRERLRFKWDGKSEEILEYSSPQIDIRRETMKYQVQGDLEEDIEVKVRRRTFGGGNNNKRKLTNKIVISLLDDNSKQNKNASTTEGGPVNDIFVNVP